MSENVYQIKLEQDALNVLVNAGLLSCEQQTLILNDNYHQCLTPTGQEHYQPISPTTADQPAEYYRMWAMLDELWVIYPAYRRGMALSLVYKIWEANRLSVRDAEKAVEWLKAMQKTHHEWRSDAASGFAVGIGRFIRERHWLTPVIDKKNPLSDPVDIKSKGWMPKNWGFMSKSSKTSK